MFARNLHLHLKPNSVAEFTRTIEKEVIPLLRKQKGFQDEITFVTPNGTEVVGISLWDEKEDAEAYGRRACCLLDTASSKFLKVIGTEGAPTWN